MTINFPLNRFIVFVKPYLNVVAAAVAAWLVAKANVLGIHGLDQSNVATYVAAALVFVITHVGSTLGDSKWLKGHHIELAAAQPDQTAQEIHSGEQDGEDPPADEPADVDVNQL